MKITVLGTRGIPDVLGGVETHCQNLYPQIKNLDSVNDITVIARSPYVNYKRSEYKGVLTKSIWAPKKKSLEAIIHSLLASFSTLFDGSDVVHVHAIGPGLVVPLLRLMGKKVIFTHHGPDYDRQKWGGFAKKVLQFGELCAVKYASEVIVISEVINNLIKDKYGRYNAHLVYNGVNKLPLIKSERISEVLNEYHLESKQYLVAVGRFVEEKGFHDLIRAYEKSGVQTPLVLVGDTDHATEYSEALKKLASDTPGVILTGFQSGDVLQILFSQAKCFIMPSYHEGLPIALLEALSYSLPVYVSNIPANLEVGLDADCYFEVGNINQLTQCLQRKITATTIGYDKYLQKYDWGKIAKQVLSIYNHALKK
ncbi:glycosyltransferase family 4 protein [Photobacterium damselae]|uniref:DUF1972 domain-containing protein n=1 Tax=Photobacterium damselae TaxID=38293 RepID=A0ABD6XAN0_PHODM|nr:glycosyltransferase family 4 protein [Photobacterium damselae]MCG3846800.1 glycosyltransferase family 4 protein [Photobacterium damselae]OBU44795.1 phosphonate ABC transporter substrate-binding protein [Photobacterium damselae]PSU18453.1 DUF1972 domain-containing protein [Photobacterium damselae]UKA11751.1 glycosyltransferase family 4 protein [Photobacterium damselae subsp. damselae]